MPDTDLPPLPSLRRKQVYNPCIIEIDDCYTHNTDVVTLSPNSLPTEIRYKGRTWTLRITGKGGLQLT